MAIDGDATRRQRPMHPAQNRVVVLDMLQHVKAGDQVQTAGKRHLARIHMEQEGVTLHTGAGQTDALGKDIGGQNGRLGQRPAQLGGDEAGAAADIQNPRGLGGQTDGPAMPQPRPWPAT